MRKRKKILAFVFLILIILIAAIYYVYVYGFYPDSRYDPISNIRGMEIEYGKPLIVYRDYPPMLGKEMVTKEEMEKGISIHVYAVRKFPHWLVSIVKVDENGEIIQKSYTLHKRKRPKIDPSPLELDAPACALGFPNGRDLEGVDD